MGEYSAITSKNWKSLSLTLVEYPKGRNHFLNFIFMYIFLIALFII